MKYFLTQTLLFLLVFNASSACAENEYSKLREKLKRAKEPEASFISNPKVDGDENQSLSMKEQQQEVDAECKAHKKSAKCLEYRRMARSRWLAEKNACAKNPVGKRCQSFRDYAFKKMLRRQSACRGGLESRKCSIVRAGAKSAGIIER
jgi:hypothetical protein